MITHRLIATVLFTAALAVSAPTLARSERVPGTEVRMNPPAGFSRADRFPGFQDPERHASIMVTEIAGPVTEVRLGMTRKGLASRGMTLIESRTVDLGGEDALLLHVSQRAGDADVLKWMLVAGSSQRTVLVVGTFPAEATDLSEPIRRSLLTVSWSGEGSADRFEGLAFRVDGTRAMRIAERMGNLLILSESGSIAPGNPDMAILVVGGSLGEAAIEDLEAFSRERTTKINRLKNVRNLRGSATVIDSLSGYELTGVGSDVTTRRSVALYQLVLVDRNTYYIAQGFVASKRMPELLPTFRRVMGTFRRVGVVETGRARITQ